MSNTTIKYIIYNHDGSGRRGHHFGTENNFVDPANGHASPGDQISAIAFANLEVVHNPDPVTGDIATFAFMSVHGAADGNHLYTSPGVYTVNVGNNDIDILVVYYPPLFPLQRDGVVWIDAFNVDTGDFSDSDFLERLPPFINPPEPHPHIEFLADDGNYNGVFPMRNNSNDPTAGVYETVDGVPFLELKKFNGANDLITNSEITVNPAEIWFAFYQTAQEIVMPVTSIIDRIDYTLHGWVSDDFCGTPYGHIPPHGPLNFEIRIGEATMAGLSGKQKKEIHGYVKAYPEIAAPAFKQMEKVLDILKGVNNIIANTKGK